VLIPDWSCATLKVSAASQWITAKLLICNGSLKIPMQLIPLTKHRSDMIHRDMNSTKNSALNEKTKHITSSMWMIPKSHKKSIVMNRKLPRFRNEGMNSHHKSKN